MKKILLSLAAVVASTFAAQAQQGISKNAIGLRFGADDGFGTEVSYQRALNNNNRLEVDLGFRNGKYSDSFKLTGLYQWVWNIEGGFHWYAGAGASVGAWNTNVNNVKDSGAIFSVAGNAGVEYNFNFPLQVFVDARPQVYLSEFEDNDFAIDFGFGARYKF